MAAIISTKRNIPSSQAGKLLESMGCELKNGRPIIYSGYRKDESSGHTFVVDGYKEEKGKILFHVNWGWGGTANGYYDILKLKDHKNRSWSTNPYAYIGLEPFKGAGLKKLNQKK